MALGTLANVDAVSEIFAGIADGRVWLLSHKGTWALRDLTPGEGPISVGLAHSDYSDTEIEEWIEATAGWNEGDKIAQERSKRKIRLVGVFDGALESARLNDGNPIKTPLKFYVEEGQSLRVWAYNQSGAVLTTGAVLVVNGSTFMKRA